MHLSILMKFFLRFIIDPKFQKITKFLELMTFELMVVGHSSWIHGKNLENQAKLTILDDREKIRFFSKFFLFSKIYDCDMLWPKIEKILRIGFEIIKNLSFDICGRHMMISQSSKKFKIHHNFATNWYNWVIQSSKYIKKC